MIWYETLCLSLFTGHAFCIWLDFSQHDLFPFFLNRELNSKCIFILENILRWIIWWSFWNYYLFLNKIYLDLILKDLELILWSFIFLLFLEARYFWSKIYWAYVLDVLYYYLKRGSLLVKTQTYRIKLVVFVSFIESFVLSL